MYILCVNMCYYYFNQFILKYTMFIHNCYIEKRKYKIYNINKRYVKYVKKRLKLVFTILY